MLPLLNTGGDAMNRREFASWGVAAAGALAFESFPRHLHAGPKKLASDRIKLGPMGVEVSAACHGNRHQRRRAAARTKLSKLGVRGLAELFKAAYDQGVTFWDAADQYGTHPHLKEALKERPSRESRHPHQDPRQHGSGNESRLGSLPPRTGNRLHRHPAAALHDGRRLAAAQARARWP
jgi:hypothetical protein